MSEEGVWMAMKEEAMRNPIIYTLHNTVRLIKCRMGWAEHVAGIGGNKICAHFSQTGENMFEA
jgi:hypothetical protein